MTSLNFANDAARRRERPVALIIASEAAMAGYQGSVLREFDVEMATAEAALAQPAALPACALLLADTMGSEEQSAASLVALAAARRRIGVEVILICPESHVDFLGALLGTGAILLCEPRPEDIDRALQDAIRVIERRQMQKDRPALSSRAGLVSALPCPWPKAETVPEPTRPYWLDILSDQLTDLAIARQATSPESAAIAKLLEQMIAQLLALIPDRILLDAVATASPGDGTAELGQLVAELERRELAVSDLVGRSH
ncbi:hypothetical protein [Sphingomonas koreensis]